MKGDILESKKTSNKFTLAIHSTDNSYCFAIRKNNDLKSDRVLIKKFEQDLCNNLIIDFNNFISNEDLKKINNMSVSIGPGNFNASRLVVVLARTISQQLNCPLNGYSSFELMARRIALKHNIYIKKQSFWIYKNLKRRGFIAGKYEVYDSDLNNKNITIKEKEAPRVLEELNIKESNFIANYEDENDLRELLNLSFQNLNNSNFKSWKDVLPLYLISPIN